LQPSDRQFILTCPQSNNQCFSPNNHVGKGLQKRTTTKQTPNHNPNQNSTQKTTLRKAWVLFYSTTTTKEKKQTKQKIVC
jgi:hypothetical protein